VRGYFRHEHDRKMETGNWKIENGKSKGHVADSLSLSWLYLATRKSQLHLRRMRRFLLLLVFNLCKFALKMRTNCSM